MAVFYPKFWEPKIIIHSIIVFLMHAVRGNQWSFCLQYSFQNLWPPSMIKILKKGRPVFLFKLVFEIRFSDALLATEVILSFFCGHIPIHAKHENNGKVSWRPKMSFLVAGHDYLYEYIMRENFFQKSVSLTSKSPSMYHSPESYSSNKTRPFEEFSKSLWKGCHWAPE